MSTARHLSPLRYPGGKARMARWVADRFFEHAGPMDVEVWVEPFCGGGGAALHALVEHRVPEAWLHELNPALAALWWACLAEPARLAARVEATVPDVDMFYACRDLVAEATSRPFDGGFQVARGEVRGDVLPGLDAFEVAWAALVVNRCSRSGILSSSKVGPIGGRQQQGRWTVASRWMPQALAGRIHTVGGLAGDIWFTHGDGVTAVEQLAGSGLEDEVLLFVDPPYVAMGDALYAKGTQSGGLHRRLADALGATTAPWLLTYDAHPDVLALYPDQRVFAFDIPHTAGRAAVGVEYLVAADNVWLRPGCGNPLGKGAIRQVAGPVDGCLAG